MRITLQHKREGTFFSVANCAGADRDTNKQNAFGAMKLVYGTFFSSRLLRRFWDFRPRLKRRKTTFFRPASGTAGSPEALGLVSHRDQQSKRVPRSLRNINFWLNLTLLWWTPCVTHEHFYVTFLAWNRFRGQVCCLRGPLHCFCHERGTVTKNGTCGWREVRRFQSWRNAHRAAYVARDRKRLLLVHITSGAITGVG